jgi:hypothetical protein
MQASGGSNLRWQRARGVHSGTQKANRRAKLEGERNKSNCMNYTPGKCKKNGVMSEVYYTNKRTDPAKADVVQCVTGSSHRNVTVRVKSELVPCQVVLLTRNIKDARV